MLINIAQGAPMHYSYSPPQRRFYGPEHWGHTIEMYLENDRLTELARFLNEVVGRNQWRMPEQRPPKKPWQYTKWRFLKTRNGTVKLKFKEKEHAFRVKLMWCECEPKELGFRFMPLPGGASLYPYYSAGMVSHKTMMGVMGINYANLEHQLLTENPCNEIPLPSPKS